MKKYITLFLVVALILSCSSDDNRNNNCRFLLNVNVNFTVNLNLPQFINLQNIQNPVLISGEGNGGLIVMKTIGDSFVAWDNADPNRTFEACSIMTITGTIAASSNCDEQNQYDINTGLPITEGLACGLQPYRIEQNGNTLFISN